MEEQYTTKESLKELKLQLEEKKFEFFRMLFENYSEKFDFSVMENYNFPFLDDKNDKELKKLVTKAMLCKRSNEIIQKNKALIDEVKENYYYEVLSKTKDLADELKLKNSLELSLLYSYLLWNGYFSKTKENRFSIQGRSLVWGMFSADIMDGIGVCLNHADMLKDFLIFCGYDSAILMNSIKLNSSVKEKINIERNYVKPTSRVKSFQFFVGGSLGRISGNHAFTLIKDNNIPYIYDSTNLALFEIVNPFVVNMINGIGSSRIRPYLSCALTAPSVNELDAISSIFTSNYPSCPYNLDDFLLSAEQKIELFKSNTVLIDDFYIDINPNLNNIKKLKKI